MADPADQPQPTSPSAGETQPFRWQSTFQKAAEPLFLLSQRFRLLGANHAWEELAHVQAESARGAVCRPRRIAGAQRAVDIVARVLYPPAEVLQGKPARVRRLVAGEGFPRQWWELDFLPFRDGKGRLRVLGKVSRVTLDVAPFAPALPESLHALRERLDQRYGLEQIASDLPAMRRVTEQVRLAADSKTPLLIVGEPGAGKEWIARTVHGQGTTRAQDFAALDCACLPTSALAAALTGDGSLLAVPTLGTLYLKEVSRLARDLQDRLATWLAEPGPRRVRLVAGNSTDPVESVRSGALLETLHCALSTLVITLPPLRDRMADLPSLVERFLQRTASGENHGAGGLTPAAWDIVRSYRWPGNLRELYSVLAGACWRTEGMIDTVHLPASMRLAVASPAQGPRTPRPMPLDQILEQVESRLITVALRQAQGNKSRAAELLSIWRARLIRRVEMLGITEE